MTRIALIPSLSPDELLIPLVKSTKERGYKVVVVDDGSAESYQPIFKQLEEYAQIVLHHGVNRGKGAALKTGYAYIAEHFQEPYVVVTLDADGQHKLDDADKLCLYVEEHPDALALGSRHLSKDVPLRSRFGNGMTRFVFRLSTGTKVYDTQTGLRAFSNMYMDEMREIGGERYEYEMNVLMYFAKAKKPIHEITIETIYIDDNASSHFNVVKDSIRIYKEILKFSASSLLGFVIDYVLFCLLNFFTGILILSNVVARIVSATVNFTVNRRFVFKSKEPLLKSAIKYAILAVCILACNTLILTLLCDQLGWNRYISKIIVEVVMFIVSWFVQRNFIFRKKDKKA